jgi:hypothetical protein
MNARPVKEIQRAHDLLLPIITGEIPFTFASAENKQCVHAMLDVLCWVLEHDHNLAFTANLTAIEEDLRNRGFILEDHGN